MCSPRNGPRAGGRSRLAPSCAIRRGVRIERTRPSAGWSCSTTSSRASVCGSASASSTELTRDAGTPAATRAPTHSSTVPRRERLLQDRQQLVAVLVAPGHRREARVLVQLGPADHVAEPLPELLLRGRRRRTSRPTPRSSGTARSSGGPSSAGAAARSRESPPRGRCTSARAAPSRRARRRSRSRPRRGGRARCRRAGRSPTRSRPRGRRARGPPSSEAPPARRSGSASPRAPASCSRSRPPLPAAPSSRSRRASSTRSAG